MVPVAKMKYKGPHGCTVAEFDVDCAAQSNKGSEKKAERPNQNRTCMAELHCVEKRLVGNKKKAEKSCCFDPPLFWKMSLL